MFITTRKWSNIPSSFPWIMRSFNMAAVPCTLAPDPGRPALVQILTPWLDLSGSDVFHICPESSHPITPPLYRIIWATKMSPTSSLGRTISHQDEAVEIWWGPNQLEGNACPELHMSDILSEKALDNFFSERCWETLRCCMGIVYQLLDSWSPF